MFLPERRSVNRYQREDKRINHKEHIKEVLKWLTERDSKILRLLLDHPILKTSQIEMMLFNDLSPSSWRNKCGERLRRLYKAHLIDRFYPPVDSGGGSAEAHYVLDTIGAKILAHQLGYEPERSRFKKKVYVTQNYQHTLKIYDFKAMLHLLNKQTMGEIIRFQIEHQTRIKYRNNEGKKGELIPDAFCIYRYSPEGRIKLFFLEVDNATEGLEMLQSKIRRYIDCFKSNAWRETDWGKAGVGFPAVLIVMHEENKELIKYSRSLKSNIRFLFTTYDQLMSGEYKEYGNSLKKTRRVLQRIKVNLFDEIYKSSSREEGVVAL